MKLIVCMDQYSVDLYKLAISSLGEAWPGAKLEVVNAEDIPQRPRARTVVPAEPSDPQTILKIVRRSNRMSKKSKMISAGSSILSMLSV